MSVCIAINVCLFSSVANLLIYNSHFYTKHTCYYVILLHKIKDISGENWDVLKQTWDRTGRRVRKQFTAHRGKIKQQKNSFALWLCMHNTDFLVVSLRKQVSFYREGDMVNNYGWRRLIKKKKMSVNYLPSVFA